MTDQLLTETTVVPTPALEGVFNLRTRTAMKIFAFKCAAFVLTVWTFAALVR